MTVHDLRATFSRGELTPRLHARADIQDYAQAATTCRNWLVMRQGGLQRRPGFIWISNVRDSSVVARVFRFEFNVEQAYALLFNGGYIRFFTLGGIVTLTAQNITGITKANPAVVTYSGSDTYANGDRVIISGVLGMTEVNNREFTVANVDTGANTFELSGINSTTYTTYTSGGTVAEIYEIAHPYAAADLFSVQIAQDADTVYLAHRDYAPRKVVRTSETSWALSTIEFDDGPYLDEDTGGTTLTLAGTGALHPIMTGLSAPSGVAAASDAGADAWEVFDADDTTTDDIAATTGNWSFDLTVGVSAICDAYWIRSGSTLGNAPSGWKLQGSADATTWVTLDTREGEEVWGRNETRFFEFTNEKAYRYHRLLVTDVDGGTGLQISGLGLHKEGDSQTAVNLTASAVTGINGDAGFASTDVGRTIRLMDKDGFWRWARIIVVTNTTVVTVKIYGHSMSTIEAITHWRLSAWSASDGYPATVGFDGDRLTWGGSDTEPLKLWESVPEEFENHAPPGATALDTDGINIRMTGGRLNRIAFIEELSPLIVGTPGTIRIVGPLDQGSALSNTNIQQKPNGTIGAAAIQPLIIGNTMLYVDRYSTRIYALSFDLNVNSYVPRELSIESDHLLLSGIIENSFQQQPDNLCWYPVGNGRVAVLTYEQSQSIAGFADQRIAGGGTDDATVESTVSIPSAGGDVTYAVIKRTIDGATVRSVEYTETPFETGDTLAAAVYADAAGSTTGTDLTSVSGLWYLRGETVGVMADGIDIADLGASDPTVSATGVLTLPLDEDGVQITGDTVVWGKRFTSRLETLRAPNSGNRDGSALGRQMTVNGVKVDMLNAKGMKAGTLQSVHPVPTSDKNAADGSLNTGMFDIEATDSHFNDGVVVVTNNSMYPATLRALSIALEGEP